MKTNILGAVILLADAIKELNQLWQRVIHLNSIQFIGSNDYTVDCRSFRLKLYWKILFRRIHQHSI